MNGIPSVIATLHTHSKVTTPDGQEHRDEFEAARHLIVTGHNPDDLVKFVWADGRSSTMGPIGSYARLRAADNDAGQLVTPWTPHYRAQMPPPLSAWAARIASERSEGGKGAAKGKKPPVRAGKTTMTKQEQRVMDRALRRSLRRPG